MAARIATTVQLILAVSIFYLGYTIHNMTSKVAEVMDTYPQVLSDIDQLSQSLQVEEWLLVAATFKDLVPEVISSVDGVTDAIDATNRTASSIDQKLPMVVEEVKQYRLVTIPGVLSELEQYRANTLPKLLGEAKQYRVKVIPPMLVESKGYREVTVPSILVESEKLRAEVPPILAQADVLIKKTDQIIDKSQDLAKEAAQGAVKGVILSPIDLIREAGGGLKDRAVSVIDETP